MFPIGATIRFDLKLNDAPVSLNTKLVGWRVKIPSVYSAVLPSGNWRCRVHINKLMRLCTWLVYVRLHITMHSLIFCVFLCLFFLGRHFHLPDEEVNIKWWIKGLCAALALDFPDLILQLYSRVYINFWGWGHECSWCLARMYHTLIISWVNHPLNIIS